MSALIAHLPSTTSISSLRRALGGSGLDCSAQQCVPWEDVGKSLAHSEPDLIVIEVADDPRLNWEGLQEAVSHSYAPRLLVGPVSDFTTDAAERLGAMAHMTLHQLTREAHTLSQDLMDRGQVNRGRGNLISVLSCAGTTEGALVAEHLAAALNKQHADKVALLEVAGEESELTSLLDIDPKHTLRDAMDMWQRLDQLSFGHLFSQHSSGLPVLPTVAEASSGIVERDPLNRLLLLSRLSYEMTVLSMRGYRTKIEMETLCNSSHVVLAMLPEVPSLRRAKRFLETLESESKQCEVVPVVMRWGQAEQVKRAYLEEFFGTKSIHYLPDDPKRLNRAVNQGVLVDSFAPRAEFCKKIQKLALALGGQS